MKTARRPSKIATRSRKTGKNWILAVDPFTTMDLQPVIHLVRELSGADKIHAVFVLAPSSLNWTGDFSGPWMKRYQPIAQQKLEQMLPDAKIQKSIVKCKEPGQKAAAKALVGFAKRAGAAGLVISTHGRTGLVRMAMGSFAETAMLISTLPVLVVNPEQTVPNSVRKILVATDLEEDSTRYLANVARQAKQLSAEVVLYYKRADAVDPVIQQGVYSLGGGWVSVEAFLESDLESKNKQVEKIEAMFTKLGVKAHHIIDNSPGDLTVCIEKAAAKEHADLVSVLTKADSWSAALMGSVARGLVRTSPIPVLVRR